MSIKGDLFRCRNDFYKWLGEYVEKKSDVCKVIKPPSTKRATNDRRGKIIAVFNTAQPLQTATRVNEKIQEKLKETNDKLKSLASQENLCTFKATINVNTIAVQGDIILACREKAEIRNAVEGSDLKAEIYKYLEELLKRDEINEDIVALINDTFALLNLIDSDKLYIKARDSGSGYRVSYYSVLTEKRELISVHDILLVIGDGNTQITSPTMKKANATKSVLLGRYMGYKGNMFSVYEFNESYRERYEQRKLRESGANSFQLS